MKKGIANIEKVFLLADTIDIEEGKVAYTRYNKMLKRIADHYDFGFCQTAAAFVALSPNNDYMGNLRSLISIMYGVNAKNPLEEITVSTYKQCRNRAYDFLVGNKDFLAETAGVKTRNFYFNILFPKDTRYITLDGHMCSVWAGRRYRMKEVAVSKLIASPSRYNEIAKGFFTVAKRHKLIPNQLQAILWFTWKRINNIVFTPQLQLWNEGNHWNITKDPSLILPYK
jgi:hypothetical protein